MMKKVIVIGGGPAGMMAAIASAKIGNEVILIEKNKLLGKKLLITGKGRCNITSSLDMDDFIKNIPGNGKFLYSAFQNFTNVQMIEFLKEMGLDVKEERGNRIFPVTDKSIDVLKCFENKIRELNIKVIYGGKVNKILVSNNKVNGIIMNKNNKSETINADKVILATGGKSYPLTGSTGDGYNLVKELGHKITKIQPSLVPLVCYENKFCKKMQGLSLKNVKMCIQEKEKNKVIYQDFGEMLFTHFGVSGPIILSASSHLVRYKNISELLKSKNIILHIDLKPSLDFEKLDNRILRDFLNVKNKLYKNSLDNLLPKKMISVIIELSAIDPEKPVNLITKNERHKLVNLLKDFTITVSDFRTIDEAIITSGGINIKEVNSKTMESKLIENLYFAGEVLDVDGYTGGFNLQIAYSTGFTAGIAK